MKIASQKMCADAEKKGEPSKWSTFLAIYVLNHFTNDVLDT